MKATTDRPSTVGVASTRDPARDGPVLAPRSFLPLPPSLHGRERRLHQVVIALLLVFAAAQGTYWTFTTLAWSPVDESEHYAYVESIARGDGVPTIGVDPVSDDTLRALKDSPTNSYRSNLVTPSNTDPSWSGAQVQYEAVHGPVYYVAVAPFYWLGRPLGDNGGLYGVRLGTVLLTIAIIPLTWVLARRLFPSTPVVWLVAPAILAAANSISSGAVANDSMAMVVATLSIIAFLRALNRYERWTAAALAGAAFSLTLLTKMTSLIVVPLLAGAFVAAVVVLRPGLASTARWIGSFVAAATVVFAPWLLWNLATYGSPTGADAVVEAIGRPLLASPTLELATIRDHLIITRGGVWLGPLLIDEAYQTFWERLTLAAAVAGALACAIRRRWRDLLVLVWCAAAIPLAFVTMELIFFGPFEGNGSPVGRHLWAVLPPTTIMIAAAATFVLGTNWAPPVMAWLVALSLWLQVPMADRFVTDSYLTLALDGDLGPVIYQDRADHLDVDRTAVTLDPGCPVAAIGIGLAGPAIPDELEVRGASSTAIASGRTDVAWIPTYRLDRPVDGPITIELPPGSMVRGHEHDLSPDAAYTTGVGDPVVTAFCAVPDAEQRSFDRLYRVGHPDQISLAAVRATPRAFVALASVAAIGLTVAAALTTWRRRMVRT